MTIDSKRMIYSAKSQSEDKPLRTLQDIGKTIRQLRSSKNITGVELARRAEMSQARISRLESGILRTSAKEIETVLNILDCPATIRQQILAVLQLSSFAPPSKYRPIINPSPGSLYKRIAGSTCIRGFLYNTFPSILQTAAFRQALLKGWELSQSEFTRLMNENEKRQDFLWDGKHSFHFIVPEAALYNRLSSTQIHVGQLDRIDRISDLKQIKFGIIPMQAGLAAVEHSNFVVYDNNLVVIIYLAEEQNSSDPVAIAEHRRVFDELHQKACYNAEAQKLIRKAVEYFAY